MKDNRDKSTADIFTGKAQRGRPRRHITQAAKQKAYRDRKKSALTINLLLP